MVVLVFWRGFQNKQQHEVNAKARAAVIAAVMRREIMNGMLEIRIGFAMKKTVEFPKQGISAPVVSINPQVAFLHELNSVEESRGGSIDQAIERTFSTIRLGFGSCSCSMCGE